MSQINYESLVLGLVQPIATHPEDVTVTVNQTKEATSIKVCVNPDDLGRIIGKNGRVANSIRTLIYVAATKDGIKVDINFESSLEN